MYERIGYYVHRTQTTKTLVAEVEYMMLENSWIDTRLNEKEFQFLHQAIDAGYSKEMSLKFRNYDANSRCNLIEDKDNWFYETTLKQLSERMFYRDWENYYKYCIEKEESPPEFKLEKIWVNHQRQHEFVPIHIHDSLYSFVVFMKIPTHWEEQHALPFSLHSNVPPNVPSASDFQFIVGQGQRNGPVKPISIPLSPEDEGRMLFFPAFLHHQVYPFYGTEEERITISGNIIHKRKLKKEKEKEKEGKQNFMDITKEQMLEQMEKQVESLKKQIENEK